MSFLPSIYRAGLTQTAFSLHRADRSLPARSSPLLDSAGHQWQEEREWLDADLKLHVLSLLYGWRVKKTFHTPILTEG